MLFFLHHIAVVQITGNLQNDPTMTNDSESESKIEGKLTCNIQLYN